LKKAGVKPTKIAALLGRSPATISRELFRNCGRRGYRPKQAQQMAEDRAARTWSPEQIADRAKFEEMLAISHERIYRFVYADKAADGNLWGCLRCQKPYRFLVSLPWTDTHYHESVTAFGRANVPLVRMNKRKQLILKAHLVEGNNLAAPPVPRHWTDRNAGGARSLPESVYEGI
jgi:IS30 family transposase